jgi:uncharacterized protein
LIRLLRSSEYRRMPWKNGGGETREILVSPPGASLDALEWRVSLATVASDGPFSEFRGITRTLSVIRGAGITLEVGPLVGHRQTQQLLTSSEPYTFDGEVPASAWLIDGPIVDLNVMSRRGVARHRVTRMRLEGVSQLATSADVTLVFCRTGSVMCHAGETSIELGAEDCALMAPSRPAIEGCSSLWSASASTTASELFVIELYRELTRSGS